MDDVLDHVSEGVLVVDPDWEVTRVNDVATTHLDRDATALEGTDVREALPQSVESPFHRQFGDDDAVPAAVTFEDYFPELETWFEIRTVPLDDGLVIYLHDVTKRKDLQRSTDAREAELEGLSRINAIIQEIIRDLVGATTREEIEATVCERLAASDLYEFTWIGERSPMADRLSHRSAAGAYEGVVELLVAEESTHEVECPEQTVERTGETRIVRHLVADESIPDPVRRIAFARGLQSAIAIPIRYGTTTYGVLGVYAARADAFTDRERESLETLGVVAGFVITAARQRNLLLSDTVVELTVRVTDTEDPLVRASGRLDCSLAVEGLVPLAEDALLCYLGVEGASPSDVVDMVTEWSGLEDARVVHETAEGEAPDGGLIEVAVTTRSPLLTLAERGATVRTATFEDGVGRIVAEMAPDEDVRALVEAIAEGFPGSDLVAKRERQRAVETAQAFRSSLHERLTDRQQTALRVAYHGGYFQSPRDSTAEELAEGLGISSPTLHYHLRAAQWKLVDAFLGDTPEHRAHDTADAWHSDGAAGT